MNIKNVALDLLILTLLISPLTNTCVGQTSAAEVGEAFVSQSSPATGLTHEDKTFPSPEFLQQLIDLVVENNPTLQSQRRIIAEIESIPIPEQIRETELTLKGGIGTSEDEDTHIIRVLPSAGLELEFPLYSPSKQRSILQQKIALNKELEQAKQRYSDLKNSTISDLLNKVARLSQLDKERENSAKLKSYLSDNLHSLEKQVKAGIIEPDDLWALSERIMSLDTKIYNLSSQLKALKWETAITLGGKEWQRLLQMLDEMGA